MDSVKEREESLREAASIGDLDTIQMLIEQHHVDVNSQNAINQWTALHWAAKRGHQTIVSYLLQVGADKNIKTNKGETALDMSSQETVVKLLGGDSEKKQTMKTDLPITPNYIAHPPFPYLSQNQQPTNHEGSGNSSSRNHNDFPPSAGDRSIQSGELVLKARIANTAETDFIEVDIERSSLSFSSLLDLLCSELCVKKEFVYKIRKLPNTILRKDKDVRRLQDFQEVELVLSTKGLTELMCGYGSVPYQQPVNVVY